MGVRRRLDYILVSQCLSVHGPGPTDQLNLGSDHRAVQATMRGTKKVTTYIMEEQYVRKGGLQKLMWKGMRVSTANYSIRFYRTTTLARVVCRLYGRHAV